MSNSDAASRLRSIVALKKLARGEHVPRISNHDHPSIPAYQPAAPLVPRIQHTLSCRAWKIWGLLNAAFVVFCVFYVVAPTEKPIPKPILPLTQMELLELLQLTHGNNNGKGERPLPNWQDLGRDKLEVIKQTLEGQPRLQAKARMFSDLLHQAYAFNDYARMRSNCSWYESEIREVGEKQDATGYKPFRPSASERNFSKQDFFTYKYYATTPLWERFKPDMRNSWCEADGKIDGRGVTHGDLYSIMMPDARVEVCNFPDKRGAAHGEEWESVRIGPLKGYGGHDWHSILAYDVFPKISQSLKEHSAVWVTGYVVAPIDKSVHTLPDPPVRTRRAELASTPFKLNFPNRNPFASLFEDSVSFDRKVQAEQQLNTTYHTEQMFASLPLEHAFPIYHPVQLVADLNDVRNERAPEMDFFFEVGLRWTVRPPQTQTVRFTLSAPGQVFMNDDMKHWSNELGYWMPANKPNMNWFTGFIQQPGNLMHGQFHSKQKYFEAAYLFSGSPESLGLNRGEFQVDYKKGTLFFPDEHGIDMDDAKLLILWNAAKSNSSLRCFGVNNLENYHPSFDEIHRLRFRSSNLAPFDRLPDTHCFGDWKMKIGDQWTVVAFNRPMCFEHCAGVSGPGGGKYGVPQHSTFQGWVALEEDPVGAANSLGPRNAFDHYHTIGAGKPHDAFTASSKSDVVTAIQTANLVSGYFPPDKVHHEILSRMSKVHSNVDLWRRNTLLDEHCVA